MFLDLSTTNILLMVGVVALFILFITVLMKLNPSTEKKESLERDVIHVREVTPERQKTFPTEQSVPQPYSEVKKIIPVAVEKAVEKTVEKPLQTVTTTVGGPSIPADQGNKTPIPSRNKEVISKPEKIVAPKSENNQSSKRDCLHQFGYLRALPKNAPIPDECFGCLKVVECLSRQKHKRG